MSKTNFCLNCAPKVHPGFIIYWDIQRTTFGKALFAACKDGLCGLCFLDFSQLEIAIGELGKQWPEASFKRDEKFIRPIASAVNAAIKRKALLSLALILRGSAFELKVWQKLMTIRTGQIISYHKLASLIGSPTAYRAVGNAVGKNPIAYLIPCHRVIRASGELGNYRWGCELKRKLLEAEKVFFS